MIASYLDLCGGVDRKDCRIYIAKLLKGFALKDNNGEIGLATYASRTFTDEEIAPVGRREFRLGSDDRSPVRLGRGLREFPEMKDLILLLLKSGFDVWIVDAEAQPLLEAYAAGYGIDPKKAVGIRMELFGKSSGIQRVTGKVAPPVPSHSGKVDAMVAAVGRAPLLVIAATDEDRELLDYGSGLRLLLDHGDKVLRVYAQKRGWLVQPAFTP
jgi:hypothetical protein